MRATLSPTLRSRYDYYYSAMSPASTATNFYDHQNQSLFGDPVPPAVDFLESLDNHLYGSLRRGSSALASSNVSFLPELRPVPIGGNHLGSKSGTEINNIQRIPLTDRRDSNETFYSYNRKRSSSSFSDDFRANLDNFRNANEILPPIQPVPSKRIFSSEPLYSRRPSNQIELNRQSSSSDSRDSNSDWHRPVRHASKNVVEIGHVGDAMVAVIQDSTTSSSEDQSPKIPRSATAHSIQEVLPYDQRRHSQPVIITKPISLSSTSATLSVESESDHQMQTKTRDISPAIITHTVQTGSAYRVNPVRQHKKSSFAILNELNPNQSRATSPSGRVSPFRGKGFKSSSRVSSRPQSPSYDEGDHSKPMVQFNTQTYAEKIGPSTSKGILLRRPSLSASYADLSYRDREMESYEYRTDVKHRTLIPTRTKETLPARPFSVLPDSKKVAPSPAPRRRFYNSTGDLNSQTHENPKSYHKGLLKVVRNGSRSPSKIPRRKSLTSETEKGLGRRRSSVSPQRRFSITTNNNVQNNTSSSIIDLGTPTSNPSRSGSRISKPTTLSPIIGTPNKDSEHSAQEDDNNENLASPTKLPVRANSSNLIARANSRAASRSNSRSTSREPSPGILGMNNITGSIRGSSKNQSKSTLSRSDAGSLKKTKTKAEENQSSQSITAKTSGVSPRIPVRKSTSVKSTKKEPASTKKEPSSVKRETSNLKKTTSSIKREGSNSNIGKSSFKRESSNLKREPSNLKREPSNLKREPSNLKREPSNLKREPSNLKREPSNLKREPSNLKREPSNLKREPSKSNLKRQNSKLTMTAVLSKNNSDSALGKKLEKQNSFKVEKRRTISESDGPVDTEDSANHQASKPENTGRTDSKDKLVPMTKSSVVSMTTAAITAQPVQITTAVTNSVTSLDSVANNSNDSSGEITKDSLMSDPASIIEKSQKTLETIQKTVTEATDEIHKTIEENLTDLKSLENDIKNDAKIPSLLEKKDSTRTLIDHSKDATPNVKTLNNEHNTPTVITTSASPIEPNVSIVGTTANSLRPQDNDERISVRSISMLPDVESESGNMNKSNKGKSDAKAESEKGSGSSSNDAKSENGDAEERQGCCKCSKCCTPCISKLCIPCRRLKNLSCCKRCKRKTPSPSINSSEPIKPSCWKRMKCCGKKAAKVVSEQSLERVSTAAQMESGIASEAAPSKCSLCLDKFLCCRKTNKIESTSDAEEEGRKCCCFPCRKSKKETNAWVDRRESILSQPKKQGCCSRIFCCRRKEPSESRRTSMNSKKQSIAPTLPPEDNRPKLDESLIEHASMMKGAIPILPICLAWFCLICNCFVPGFGTILSGLFCLCLGIPRFSQHDGAKVRIGSFVINCLVGVAQAFTLLFCLVGWGWSIWWGTIMLRVSRKHRKLKLAEDREQEEQTTSSNRTSNPPAVSQNHRDVEAANRAT